MSLIAHNVPGLNPVRRLTTKLDKMEKAERILEKHINGDDLHFIFHDKKELWQELLNAVNEALGLAPVVGQSEQLLCKHCNNKKALHSETTGLCPDRFKHFEAK